MPRVANRPGGGGPPLVVGERPRAPMPRLDEDGLAEAATYLVAPCRAAAGDVQPMLTFTALPPGGGLPSMSNVPALSERGYTETEYVATGTARAYVDDIPEAPFATRVLVRRPTDDDVRSGTVVVEWLNVSAGFDAAPAYAYLAEEFVRRGHVWIGVSAQHVSVYGGAPIVDGLRALPALRDADPSRYADLHHPGDAYSFDIFAQVDHKARAEFGPADIVLAVGESQSAFTLTTFVNEVAPRERIFDGFLLHSRGGGTAPLDVVGRGLGSADFIGGVGRPVRDDLDVPVMTVVTETDVLGFLDFLRARQPDTDRIRTWEIAGTAHGDHFVIAAFEALLGCPEPVNRGQQVYVARAAFHHLDRWARGGAAPPQGQPLEVSGRDFVTDLFGNALGGVRSPKVDVPVELLSGLPLKGVAGPCTLFGRTAPVAPDLLQKTYTSAADYLSRYEKATDACIEAGFSLADDRDAILAEARPGLVSNLQFS